LEEACRKVGNESYDIILMDLNLPDGQGIASLRRVLSASPDVPIVVLTGLDDRSLAIRAIQEGAQDYLVKGEILEGIFWRVICYAIERKKTEAMIRHSLKEKDMLLKEVHHRVKNNLQVISSLLNLQSRSIVDTRDMQVFQESQNRIRSIAMIHEKLYTSDDMDHIDFQGYLDGLIRNLYHSYKVDADRIRIQVRVENMKLGLDKAVPCALILNELLSNALKYAFPDSFSGEPLIEVEFSKKSSQKSLMRVRDNGVGLPRKFDLHARESLGLYLVNLLAEEQLGGSLDVSSGSGTEYTLSFPF